MRTHSSVAAHWTSPAFDEGALQSWAENLRRQLPAPSVSLGLAFLSPRAFPHAEQILELLRVHARIPLLVGCSGHSLIAGDQEVEKDPGVALALFHLPGAQLHGVHLTQRQLEESTGPGYWHMETELTPDAINGWLVFADPFTLDCEHWLQQWNLAYPELPVVGGLASGRLQEQMTRLYLNGQVLEEGAVLLAVGGEVELRSVISQGCTPIGETWTITRAEENFIHEIGNRPAYEVLAETFSRLPAKEQAKSRGNLFVGLVINEYLEEFHRGDFLIRNLVGADPRSGALAVMAAPRTGQTLQFQRRDAVAAADDMRRLLDQARQEMASQTILGGCLCCCGGRGYRLFGEPSHDARLVQQYLGPLGLAGFFCNGEIGPVGARNFLHGYTASLALFVRRGR